jgi:hypothetical protein
MVFLKGVIMTWNEHLKNSVFISNRLGLTSHKVVRNWITRQRVPPKYFKELSVILEDIGQELTPAQMRELNEHNNHN